MFVSDQLTVTSVRDMPPVDGNRAIDDEHSLVAMAKSGHQEAFAELYRRHQPRSYRAALRILRNRPDAEDAVQRAFERALAGLGRFREESSFSTWLIRIAINEALMLLRRRRPPDPGLEIVDGGPTPEDVLCESERRTALLQAIGQLRQKQKIVLLYRELGGLTSAETARLLGLTVASVKARLFHARKSLRKHLKLSLEKAGTPSKLKKGKA